MEDRNTIVDTIKVYSRQSHSDSHDL